MPKIEDPFKGVIDGAKIISDQGVRIWGWACKIKSNQDQTIALYVGGDQKTGTLLKTITTDVNSEDGIQRSCQNQNSTNRYGLNITQKEAYSHAGKPSMPISKKAQMSTLKFMAQEIIKSLPLINQTKSKSLERSLL